MIKRIDIRFVIRQDSRHSELFILLLRELNTNGLNGSRVMIRHYSRSRRLSNLKAFFIVATSSSDFMCFPLIILLAREGERIRKR